MYCFLFLKQELNSSLLVPFSRNGIEVMIFAGEDLNIISKHKMAGISSDHHEH